MIAALALPSALRRRIEAEALHALPRECCGLIEGRREGERVVATAVHPARNLSDSPDLFVIDPADHFSALRAARAREGEIVGCYHSHPNGVAEPSLRDLAGAAEAGFVWAIAAASPAGAVSLMTYVFDGAGFLPIATIEIASLDPVAASRV